MFLKVELSSMWIQCECAIIWHFILLDNALIFIVLLSFGVVTSAVGFLGCGFVTVTLFQDLKNLRTQLYSAAEYFEMSYTNDDQKHMWVVLIPHNSHLQLLVLKFIYFNFLPYLFSL